MGGVPLRRAMLRAARMLRIAPSCARIRDRALPSRERGRLHSMIRDADLIGATRHLRQAESPCVASKRIDAANRALRRP
jgi:hypothetical protein